MGHGEGIREGGRPAWSRIPRITGERKSSSLQAHAGRRRSAIPHTPSGREPLLFGGKRLHATVPRFSTGSQTIFLSGRGTPWARARLIYKPSEADVIDQPQSQEIRPDTGPTVTHEGKRNAGHRHQPHPHPNVDQRMVEEKGRNP